MVVTKPTALAAIFCAVLLLGFAVLSYSAVLTKNATVDEPTHAMSGWLAIRHDDFRLETVNPSLWKCWAALPNCFVNLKLLPDDRIWSDRTWDPVDEVTWSAKMLFAKPGVNGAAFVNRSRAMMLLLGVGLGALISRWSWRLCGSVAAVVSTTLFCLDPNFIAHAPMVKSDMAFALALLGLAYSAWRLGHRATWSTIFATALICAIAPNLKFSGLIAGPILAILLMFRAMLPKAWEFHGRVLQTRAGRLAVAIGVCLLAAICWFALTWACYGFRFRPAPSPAVQMDMAAIFARTQLVETTVALMHTPTPQELVEHVPSPVARFVKFADRRHLLPQAMLAGLLYQHTCIQTWPAFLNGERYGNGRWTYFPLATLYKTPISELAAYAATLLVLLIAWITRHRPTGWTIACLLIPFSIFTAAALTTHLNIGLRNALPAFPFLQIAAGCAAAHCWRYRPRITGAVLGLLAIGLAYETLSAWPDYIAFFNASSGGPIGGIAHLGDSNLDWGQDIAGLARWQQLHPGPPLYTMLEYSVYPEFYGLRYREIRITPTGPHAGVPEPEDQVPGLIAVSASKLQGLYVKPWEAKFLARLRASRPLAVIGGTIYLYRFDPSDYQQPM